MLTSKYYISYYERLLYPVIIYDKYSNIIFLIKFSFTTLIYYKKKIISLFESFFSSIESFICNYYNNIIIYIIIM